MDPKKRQDLEERRDDPLRSPTDLPEVARRDVAGALNAILADVFGHHRDVASTSLIEVWIDETERRTWFLFESSGRGETGGR